MVDVFHLANWRPITHAEYAQELLDAAGTMDNPTDLKVVVTDLGDTRIAMVTHAHVSLGDGTGEVGPYLMVVGFVMPEGPGIPKSHCFVRQVELALG